MTDHAIYMQEALGLAAQALFFIQSQSACRLRAGGCTGRVIGRGFTQQAGGPHAEVMALRDAAAQGRGAQGATAYVDAGALRPPPGAPGRAARR